MMTSLHGIFTHGIYAHVPRFSEGGRPKTTLRFLIYDYLRSNAATDMVTLSLLAANLAKVSPAKFAYINPAKHWIAPLPFLLKLAIVRLFTDLGFYAGHRALHHRSLYWIHRYHHSHFKPVLATNFHFSPLDLFVEAAFPVILGLGTMDALGIRTTQLENALIIGYVGWHEQGSHCGKPLPTITYFPPLAPLYQLFFGPVDANNVRHHDLHHALLNCNYGITIWPDVVMGTRRTACDPEAKLVAQSS